MLFLLVLIGVVILLALIFVLKSFHSVGPAQVGLVNKRIGAKLGDDQLVAIAGRPVTRPTS